MAAEARRPEAAIRGRLPGVVTMRSVGRLAELIAASAGALSRTTGRGGGTSLPGMVLNRLEPGALARLGGGLGGGAVFISATNGKTTTARLLSACLRADGRDVTANAAGANLASGVTATLLARERQRRGGRGTRSRTSTGTGGTPDIRRSIRRRGNADGLGGADDETAGCGGIGVFEVDEGALGPVAGALAPRALVLMNLFRDQLDRYGELEAIADRWGDLARGLGPATTLVLNADDPALAHLGADQPNVVLFGIDDPAVGRPDLPHAADTVRCVNCGRRLSHDLVTVGHLGHWRCEGCGLRRPEPHVRARRVRLDGLDRLTLTISGPAVPPEADEAAGAYGTAEIERADDFGAAGGSNEASGAGGVHGPGEAGEAAETGGAEFEITAGIGGLHNAYNVTAAVAAALALGVPAGAVRTGVGDVRAAFGRAEQVSLDGRTLRLLLAKNPTGANENIRCLLVEPAPLHLLVVLNDRTADGRDPSWIWDVDYEPLWDRIAGVTLAGDRCWELALRFSYGGLAPERFDVQESLTDALDSATSATPPGGVLHVLPTYTALLDLRAELVRRGAAHDFWQET